MNQPLVALCRQCAAPLTLADLGYDICLNCHWQNLFDYVPGGEQGEAELTLPLAPGRNADEAADSAGRTWRRFPGDGATWCALCGETIVDGWKQGAAGGPQIHICAEHIRLSGS